MRVSILILAIIGSILAIGIGACSGACLSGLGDMAEDGGEGAAMGGELFAFAIGQAIFGLVGGISSYNALGRNERPGWLGKLGLLIGGGMSITNTFVFMTAGACHLIAALLAFIAKPQQSSE